MKILKHGFLNARKFACAVCGCEFVADASEYTTTFLNKSPHWYTADCPDCFHSTSTSEPWEEKDETSI